MARDFGPFPSKPMYEVVNRRMQRALAEARGSTGFARSGQGAVTAGSGAELVIAAYPDGALVDGLYVENDTSETVTLTTNTGSTNPRIDRLVLRLDMAAETIEPFQIVGTPAASPSAPALTQTETVYDLPLCQYRFPGSASAQNPTSIVDERKPANDTYYDEGSGGGTIGTAATAPTDSASLSLPAGTYDVDFLMHFIVSVAAARQFVLHLRNGGTDLYTPGFTAVGGGIDEPRTFSAFRRITLAAPGTLTLRASATATGGTQNMGNNFIRAVRVS